MDLKEYRMSIYEYKRELFRKTGHDKIKCIVMSNDIYSKILVNCFELGYTHFKIIEDENPPKRQFGGIDIILARDKDVFLIVPDLSN